MAQKTFRVPDVEQALAEAGLGCSRAAANRWLTQTPGVVKVRHGLYRMEVVNDLP